MVGVSLVNVNQFPQVRMLRPFRIDQHGHGMLNSKAPPLLPCAPFLVFLRGK